MISTDQRQIVVDVTREIIVQNYSEELTLFRSTVATYMNRPEDLFREKQQGKDDLLGFGAGEVAVFLTPYVLMVMTEVVKFIAEEVQKSLVTKSAAVINETLKKLFRRVRPEENDLLPLTPAQLTQVRNVAYENARRLKLPDDQANLLASAITGTLLS
jgi:hypothetical protein